MIERGDILLTVSGLTATGFLDVAVLDLSSAFQSRRTRSPSKSFKWMTYLNTSSLTTTLGSGRQLLSQRKRLQHQPHAIGDLGPVEDPFQVRSHRRDRQAQDCGDLFILAAAED